MAVCRDDASSAPRSIQFFHLRAVSKNQDKGGRRERKSRQKLLGKEKKKGKESERERSCKNVDYREGRVLANPVGLRSSRGGGG